MFSVPSLLAENQNERLGEFESRSMKIQDAVKGFHLLAILQTLPRFSPGYEGTENMFYFFV